MCGWLTLKHRILEIPGSILCSYIGYPDPGLLVFVSPSKQVLADYLLKVTVTSFHNLSNSSVKMTLIFYAI